MLGGQDGLRGIAGRAFDVLAGHNEFTAHRMGVDARYAGAAIVAAEQAEAAAAQGAAWDKLAATRQWVEAHWRLMGLDMVM